MLDSLLRSQNLYRVAPLRTKVLDVKIFKVIIKIVTMCVAGFIGPVIFIVFAKVTFRVAAMIVGLLGM